MTTKQEFDLAIQVVQSCTATLQCGCEFDVDDAVLLRRACNRFISAYNCIGLDE